MKECVFCKKEFPIPEDPEDLTNICDWCLEVQMEYF